MLPEALRLLRVFHELKQVELAEKLQISNSHISEIENGNRTPSLDVLEKYSVFFKIPMSSIMFFAEKLDDAKNKKGAYVGVKTAISKKVIQFLKVIEENTGR